MPRDWGVFAVPETHRTVARGTALLIAYWTRVGHRDCEKDPKPDEGASRGPAHRSGGAGERTLLDFEATPTFTLQVRVTDSGTPSLSDTAFVTIQLNDLSGVTDAIDPVSGGTPVPTPTRVRVPRAASSPAWQGFDPLPILAGKKRDKKAEKDEKQEDDWQEQRIQRLLDPINSENDA